MQDLSDEIKRSCSLGSTFTECISFIYRDIEVTRVKTFLVIFYIKNEHVT